MSSLFARSTRLVKRKFYGPRINVALKVDCLRLGSEYGGWVLADLPSLHSGTVLSCGLGEDASFDVEVARRFGATVIMVDPTPRAITHFDAMLTRLGQPAQRTYVSGGTQPVEAYDLTDIRDDQFFLVPKALAEASGSVRFYSPVDPAAVSHSVVNFQHGYSKTTPFIEVPSIDFVTLVNEFRLDAIALVKFDIEGAEITVIPQMLDAGIRPEQVLVEFDELNWPSRRARENFDRVHGRLIADGYLPFHFDKRSCFSYIRPEN